MCRIKSIVCVMLFLSAGTASAGYWSHEIVDATGDVGRYSSLALDTNGNPHISYYDITNTALKYTKKIGVTWSIETVDATGWVGWYTSLVLDTNDNPHISYLDWTNGNLKYAKKIGGSWSIEIVDAAGDVGHWTSIALDANGNPHISYLDNTNDDLKYAKKISGIWNIETVDTTGDVKCSSLALDANGNPHIGYYIWTIGDLKYAKKIGGSWSIETADATGNVGHWTSIALDANGNPHISYYDAAPNHDLKYAKKIGATWNIETVDATGYVGMSSSIALDANGNPHISYWDNTNDDLKYAKKIGGTWGIETVDSTEDVGRFTSLALDANGNPHISHLDGSNWDLKYATIKITIIATIDIDPDVLRLNSRAPWIICYMELPEGYSVEDIDLNKVAIIAIDGESIEPIYCEGKPTEIGDYDADGIPDLMVMFDRKDLIEILEEILGPLDHGVYVELTVTGELADGTEFAGVDTIRVIKGRAPSIGPQTADEIPHIFALYEIYPNPFSNRAHVDYALPNRASVDIKIYDVGGKSVKTLVSERLDPGYYKIDWRGNDDTGRKVSAGVYFIRMITEEYQSQHKVIFVR